MFSRYYHTMTPCNGFTIGYTLDDTKCLIAKEIFVDSLLPMKGNVGRGMASLGCSRSPLSISCTGFVFECQGV